MFLKYFIGVEYLLELGGWVIYTIYNVAAYLNFKNKKLFESL